MSVRIYEISKQINLDNKELLALLRERGYQVRSASSSIDSITAEALLEEFTATVDPDATETPATAGDATAVKEIAPEPAEPAPETKSKGPKFPPGVFVRSAEDIKREKQEKEEAERQVAEVELQRKRKERDEARQAAEATARKQAKNEPGGPKAPPPMAPPPIGGVRKAPPGAAIPRPAPGARRLPPGAGKPQDQDNSNLSNRSAATGGRDVLRPPVVRDAPTPAPTPTPTPTPAKATGDSEATRAPSAAGAPPKAHTSPKPAQASTPESVKSAESPKAPESLKPPVQPRAPEPASPPQPMKPGVVQAPTSSPKAPAIPPGIVTAPVQRTDPAGHPGQISENARIEEREGVRILHVKPPVVVREFAQILGVKPFRLTAELMELGVFANMNMALDEEVAAKVADRHGFLLEVHHRGEEKVGKVADAVPEIDEDDPSQLTSRPPVVCVLGHVDHGKTTLVDTIRKSKVAAGEAGGITQHTAAYQVDLNNQKITFIDTPGHAAFSQMRERGARITDIAILVIAADDGFKPQTEEALKFCQKNNVPVVVAINKMDARGANVDRVMQQMQQKGIAPEDYGGETLCQPVSALKGENIDELLEQVLLQAEIMELAANPQAKVKGTILEAQVEQGRGSTATVIIEKGTLKPGTALVCGTAWCKVRSMLNEFGKPIKSAPPSTPVRLMGWSEPPSAGATFHEVKNDKIAKREAQEALDEIKRLENAEETEELPNTVDELLAAIDAQKKKVLRIIIKCDVQGSVEALVGAFHEIKSEKVDLKIIRAGVGLLTKNDVMLASTSDAAIVSFNTKTENGVIALAKHHEVRIISHSIIYELIDQVQEAMADLLDPEYSEVKIGGAEVRQVFPVAKGRVAGCMVTDGTVKRNALARLVRGGETVFSGRVSTLRRFKEDVKEVRAGYECGIALGGTNDYAEGDHLEFFEVNELKPSL